MNNKAIKRAKEIVASATVKNGVFGGEYCSLVLVDIQGYPTASVLTAAKSEGISKVWFCTGLESNKVARIKANNKASVHFGASEHSITLVGEVGILTDDATKKAMWYDGLEYHFEKGYADPNYCVLAFTAKRYNIFVDDFEIEGEVLSL